MQEVKPFLISTIDTLRKSSWCWLCGNLLKAGEEIAICRYGNGDNDWEKAHRLCAEESQFNAESENESVSRDGMHTIGWIKLDQYEGRNRYAVSIDGTEVHRTAARERARGMQELLENYPEAASVVFRKRSLVGDFTVI